MEWNVVRVAVLVPRKRPHIESQYEKQSSNTQCDSYICNANGCFWNMYTNTCVQVMHAYYIDSAAWRTSLSQSSWIFFPIAFLQIYAFLSNCSRTPSRSLITHKPCHHCHAGSQMSSLTMRMLVPQIDICVNVADNDCYYIYWTLFYVFIGGEHNALLLCIGCGLWRTRSIFFDVCVRVSAYVVSILRSI